MIYNLHASEVPTWNLIPHVKTGYRSSGEKYRTYLHSLFKWHNETTNVWSMIMVNIVSLVCLLYVCIVLKPTVILPFVLLYLSSLIHLPFSVGYHLFMPMSKSVNTLWYKLDFCFILVGISLLIFAMCFFALPMFYTLCVCGLALLITIIAWTYVWSCHQKCSKKTNAILVSFITALLLIPLVYQTRELASLALTLGIVVCLLFGAYCYKTSFLNMYTPSFNSSHTTMHIMVLIAHVLEYMFVTMCYLKLT